MGYIEGEDRNQITLFPECMDDYVSEDNAVRFIDKYVRSLDLVSLGFERAIPNRVGAPSYDPRTLIMLYVYGYLNGIRSSRKIERETHRNIELIWLLNKLRPDFKTIADFRKDNRQALKNLFKDFLKFCQKCKLLGNKFIAIDGSHFKAVNAQSRHYTKNKIDKRLKEIDKYNNEYLDTLDKMDKIEDKTKNGPTTQELIKALEDLQREKTKLSKLKEDIQKTGKDQMCTTDPDSCVMRQGVGYNVQIAVDSENSLIVAYDVTDAPVDNNQLSNMAKKAKDELNVDELEATADTGYYNHSEIKECVDNQITPYVPEPLKTGNPKADKLFSKSNFKYHKDHDCYVCPCNNVLLFYEKRKAKKGGYNYTYKCVDHVNCPFKNKCTTSKLGRYVNRWEHEDIINNMKESILEDKDKVKKRKAIVEHPFGTIKREMDQGYFLMRGKDKVNTEFALTSLVYNIKRVINIFGIPKLMKALA
ncbi:MAG: IS1182 family transposase [Candidatus Dependentiae bacterium]